MRENVLKDTLKRTNRQSNRYEVLSNLNDEQYPHLSSSNGRKKRRFNEPVTQKRPEEDDFPKFLIVKAAEGNVPIRMVSAFKIKREIKNLCGNVRKIQPLPNGCLLIEILTPIQGEKLLKMDTLVNKKVIVSWHTTLNKSKGVVSCNDFSILSDEELKEELKEDNVVDVKRIQKTCNVNGQKRKKDTGTFVLTFNSPKLPQRIESYYYPLKVREFIPNPIRCNGCQIYGHIEANCKSKKKICGNCSQQRHPEGTDCSSAAKCARCEGDHPVWARSCPVFDMEFKIMKLKTTQKVSYYVAKRMYLAANGNTGTYRDALVSDPVCECGRSRRNIQDRLRRNQQNQDSDRLPESDENLHNNVNRPGTGAVYDDQNSGTSSYVTDDAEMEFSPNPESFDLPAASQEAATLDGVSNGGAGESSSRSLQETGMLLAQATATLLNQDITDELFDDGSL
ncbi:Zinc finger, CCHC-type [Sergentomyia squamirostris]